MPIRRGVIFDAQGHELAVSRDTVSIGIKPQEVLKNENSIIDLSKFLKTSDKEIRKRILESDKFFYLKRKIPLEEAEPLKKLNLLGVEIQDEPDRYYPNHRLASQILGFTGVDGEGLSGVEYQFNSALLQSSERDFVGNNIHLTLNSFVQHQLENTLADGLEKSNSKHAMGIILETHTGRVLAMASIPDFDPNWPKKSSDATYRNEAISFRYEPGSTFKIFSMASLLRKNLLNEETHYNCPGYFEYHGQRISCPRKHGDQTFVEVMKNSCNYGVIQATWQISVLELYENLRAFGFHTQTDIPLPGETRGHLPSPKDWDFYLKMSIPIGHGVSVTPLQLAVAANAVGNDGVFLSPLLVDRITNSRGNTIEKFTPQVKYQALSAEFARKIRKVLREVVKSGTGANADLGLDLKDFDVCGKTGTSLKSTNKGYDKKKYQASFVGFFPCEKPEITILIMFDEPRGELHQGATVAAPAFRRVLLEIIPAIHIGDVKRVEPLPTPAYHTVKSSAKIMPDFRRLSKKELIFQVLSKYQGDHEYRGSGYVMSQHPAPGKPISPPYRFSFDLGFPDD